MDSSFEKNSIHSGTTAPENETESEKESTVTYENLIENETVKKKRGVGRAWLPLNTFPSEAEAINFIESQHCWKVKKNYDTALFSKTEYRCNFNTAKTPCPCALLLSKPKNNMSATISTYENHIHMEKQATVSSEVMKRIKSLAQNKMKATEIRNALQVEFVSEPPKRKCIQNTIYRDKTLRFETEKVSLGDMYAWMQKKSAVPDDNNGAFVLNYETSPPLSQQRFFRFAVTTKYMLGNALKSRLLHADATYKLNWHGFPIFVIGCTDHQRKFHPILFGAASSETEEDFAFLFKSLKDGIEKHFQLVYEPHVLIADAAPAISNAFRNIFADSPNLLVIMCFMHVMHNIEKYKFGDTSKMVKDEIKNDVRSLHAAPSKQAYCKAQKLFIAKYENRQPEFSRYMENTWMSKIWYEGARHFTPSTNNAVEATNSVLKRDYTYRERTPFQIFKHNLLSIVESMSKRHSDEKPFEENVNITIEDWCKASAWIELNKKIVEETSISKRPKYYIQASANNGNTKTFNKAIQDYKKKSWKNFER